MCVSFTFLALALCAFVLCYEGILNLLHTLNIPLFFEYV
jgi:uncharacterized protein YjeT (DUF2065 family)